MIFCISKSILYLFIIKYGELSLTTNPGYALYSTPIRTYTSIPSPTSATSVTTLTNNHQHHHNLNSTPATVLRSKSPPNIYTRLPLKDYTSASLTPSSPTAKMMTSSIVGFGNHKLSPTKHLLVTTTTPFMEHGGSGDISTNLADQYSIHSVRMPLLNTNYATAISNRINNGIITNGVISQLTHNIES